MEQGDLSVSGTSRSLGDCW